MYVLLQERLFICIYVCSHVLYMHVYNLTITIKNI